MNKYSGILFLLFSLLPFSPLLSQDSKFNVGLVLGLNFAELEGESVWDFPGLNTGIVGKVILSDKWSISTEILFSQNGEYILPDYWPIVEYKNIQLNHLEVPLYVSYKMLSDSNKPRTLHLQAGFAWAKLLDYSAHNLNSVDLSDEIIYSKETNIFLQMGALFFFNEHLAFNVKGSIPFASNLDLTIATRLIYFIN